MAKKKPKRPKRILKRPTQPIRRREEPVHDIPDRRVMDGVMRRLMGELVGSREETPLSKAQDLMDKAFESHDPMKRVELAKKALELSPDCADAYVVLAEQTKSRKEALELFEKGVAAGERALGPEAFQNHVGDFWGLIETRPYMRAREGLASLLWTMGRRDEAIGHLQDMLRLNPNDNQGVRDTLVGWLLAEGSHEKLVRLLEQYNEDSATWAYTKALVAFRQHGDTAETRKLLELAKAANKHVPAYLLSQEPLPREQPAYYSPGDRNEAALYAVSALSGWRETPGATAWLKATEQGKKKKRSKDPTPESQGPTPAVKEQLQELSQVFDVWQADFRLMPHWIRIDGEPARPWIVLITSRSDDLVLAHDIIDEPPSSNLLWDVLAKAMTKPAMGEPHRPTELQVRSDERWDELEPHLDEIGITVVPTEELDQLDDVFGGLARHLAGDGPPGLLEMPGIKPEQVAGFYRAAAGFYRRAPWRKLGYETAIKIECDRFESGPWYAVVMGQSGLTFGLALYDDLKMLEKLWAGEMSDEESSRETVALTVTFDDETGIPVADLDASRRLGWEVAGPEAYPSIFRKERGLSIRPPLAWELELMEGCLRAVPAFVARHRPDDLSTRRMTVPVAPGDLGLILSWVEH
jgi:tetratricopeptide (TPR) repeat protein